MAERRQHIIHGLRDGIPIAMGYFAVTFVYSGIDYFIKIEKKLANLRIIYEFIAIFAASNLKD